MIKPERCPYCNSQNIFESGFDENEKNVVFTCNKCMQDFEVEKTEKESAEVVSDTPIDLTKYTFKKLLEIRDNYSDCDEKAIAMIIDEKGIQLEKKLAEARLEIDRLNGILDGVIDNKSSCDALTKQTLEALFIGAANVAVLYGKHSVEYKQMTAAIEAVKGSKQ